MTSLKHGFRNLKTRGSEVQILTLWICSENMQGNRLIGVALQYLLIEAFRLRQAALVVMLYGEVYRLLDS